MKNKNQSSWEILYENWQNEVHGAVVRKLVDPDPRDVFLKIEVRIPYRLPSGNKMKLGFVQVRTPQQWRFAVRQIQDHKKRIWGLLKEAMGTGVSKTCTARARVTVFSYRLKTLDEDNFRTGAKFLIDQLRYVKYVRDDDQKAILHGVHRQMVISRKYRDLEHTQILIDYGVPHDSFEEQAFLVPFYPPCLRPGFIPGEGRSSEPRRSVLESPPAIHTIEGAGGKNVRAGRGGPVRFNRRSKQRRGRIPTDETGE